MQRRDERKNNGISTKKTCAMPIGWKPSVANRLDLRLAYIPADR